MVILNPVELIIVINHYMQMSLNLLTQVRLTLKCYYISYYSVVVKYHDQSKLQKISLLTSLWEINY